MSAKLTFHASDAQQLHLILKLQYSVLDEFLSVAEGGLCLFVLSVPHLELRSCQHLLADHESPESFNSQIFAGLVDGRSLTWPHLRKHHHFSAFQVEHNSLGLLVS